MDKKVRAAKLGDLFHSHLKTVLVFLIVTAASGKDAPHCHTEGLPVVKKLEDFPVDSYGRPGLTHMTIAGNVHHGMKEVEVWMQTFGPRSGTSIHRHDCEEVFVVLRGKGTLFSAENSISGKNSIPGNPAVHTISSNTTFTVFPNDVHQVRNTETEGDLQLLVIISRPPVIVFKYSTWDTPHSAAERVFPYPWDAVCPEEIGGARLTSTQAPIKSTFNVHEEL